MSLVMRLDTTSATFADLEAFLAAARAGGIGKHTPLSLEGAELVLATDAPQAVAHTDTPRTQPEPEATVRTVLDLLANRLQER